MDFLYFTIPVLLWIGIVKLYRPSYSLMEAGIQLVFSLVLFGGISILGSYMQFADTKFVNGEVTQLIPKRQSCNTSWSRSSDSFCTNQRTKSVYDGQSCSGSGKNRSCHSVYHTEYKSIYSWERRYFVKSTIGNYEIRRVDSQGVTTPPRFAEVLVGDPTSGQVSFVNYIKGASDSLFNEQFLEVAEISYPRISDYYRSNRVIYANHTVDPAFWRDWNKSLAEVNRAIIPSGANVIVVVTAHNKIWAEQLAQGWDAHNINDVVVVIGTDNVDSDDIAWVDVRSWSSTDLVNVEIRNEIIKLGTIVPESINSIIIDSVNNSFTLQDMAAFEYLAEDIPTPLWVKIVGAIILLLVTPGITYYFVYHVDIR